MNVRWAVSHVKWVRRRQAHPPRPVAGRNEQRTPAVSLGFLQVLGKISPTLYRSWLRLLACLPDPPAVNQESKLPDIYHLVSCWRILTLTCYRVASRLLLGPKLPGSLQPPLEPEGRDGLSTSDLYDPRAAHLCTSSNEAPWAGGGESLMLFVMAFATLWFFLSENLPAHNFWKGVLNYWVKY